MPIGWRRARRCCQSFPHGFTLFLASTNLLLGEAHTVAGLPALGITFLLGIVTLAKTAGVRVGAVLVVGLIVVVHPITVWFSTFPVSEALYSVVIVGALYRLDARRSTLRWATPHSVGSWWARC